MSEDKSRFLWETPPDLWRGLRPAGSSWQGKVVSIFIARNPAGPMISVAQVQAFADRGLEGDRFFRDSWAKAERPDKAVTLIEEETLQLAAAELGLEMFAEKTRRNILTRGVPLVDLLNREFRAGGVLMRGLRLFEPCGHLEKVSQIRGIFRALEHRSGLKAAILSDGVIQAGDPVSLRAESDIAAARSL